MTRYLLIILLFLFLFVSGNSYSGESAAKVEIVSDLQKISLDAQKRNLPVMVFFAAEDCEYCERLETDYLAAMAHSKEYANKVIIKKVLIDSYRGIQDFAGQSISASDFSNRFNIQVTPTLMLVDHSGKLLTKKIVGYND